MHSLKRREEAGEPPWLGTVSFLLPWMLSKAAKVSSCWIYFTDCRAVNALLSASCLNWCVPEVRNKGSASKPSGEKPVSLSAGFCFDITSLLLSSQLTFLTHVHTLVLDPHSQGAARSTVKTICAGVLTYCVISSLLLSDIHQQLELTQETSCTGVTCIYTSLCAYSSV